MGRTGTRQAGVCRLADQHARLTAILDQLRPALVDALEQVRQRAPQARVLLVGYPQLLPDSGTCPRLPRMREQDRERIIETVVSESAPVAQRYSKGSALAFELSTNLATATG